MREAQSNYYEVLGLPPSATPDEIKRRYRELARRYHPDVNSNPEAGQKIKSINEAYHVLGDEDRRATYDATRLLQSRAAPRPNPASRPASSPPGADAPPRSSRTSAPGSSRPPFNDQRVGYNGFGRTAPEPPPSYRAGTGRSGPTPGPHGTTRRTSGPFAEADRLVAEAQLAFINHRYREAENLCQEVLLIDRRNPEAQELLGDICLKRGQNNRAATHYSYAIQFNPRNYSVQAKLDRLFGRQREPSAGPTFSHPPPVSSWERVMDGPHREAGMALLSTVLCVAFLGIFYLLGSHPGATFATGLPLFSDLSLHLLGALAINGVIAGVLLAFYGAMRPISEELLERRVSASGQPGMIPLGTVLLLFALVWFYLSLIVYIGIGIAKDRISPSILRLYGAVIVLTVMFACLYKPDGAPNATLQAAAFSGNVLLPTMMLGWAVGDVVRLRAR
jgi:curved DNA-binding protein CbpA